MLTTRKLLELQNRFDIPSAKGLCFFLRCYSVVRP